MASGRRGASGGLLLLGCLCLGHVPWRGAGLRSARSPRALELGPTRRGGLRCYVRAENKKSDVTYGGADGPEGETGASGRKRPKGHGARSRNGRGAGDAVHSPSDYGLRKSAPLNSVQSIQDHVEALLRQRNEARRNGHAVADPSALHVFQEAHFDTLDGASAQAAGFHVVVCFGKRLVRDQMTLEGASRIRTLVKYLKKLQTMKRRGPEIICFTGGFMGDSAISSASASYLFFRQMGECAGVDISSAQVLLEEESICSRDALQLVVPEVSEAALAGGLLPRDPVHYTLISSTHHLRRLEIVHEMSPPSSMLSLIESRGGSLSILKASYPFLSSPDESLNFLALTMLVVEDLVPVLVNLQAAARGLEWFRRENLQRLLDARRNLNELITDLHDPAKPPNAARFQDRHGKNPLFLSAARKQFLQGEANLSVEEELEAAAASLSQLKDLMEPTMKAKAYSGMRGDFDVAASVLEQTIARMRLIFDPDRPLQMNEMIGLLQEQRKSAAL